MKNKHTWAVCASISMVVVIAALWVGRHPGVTRGLSQYFNRTTVEMMPLHDGCNSTNDTPPASLMRIVREQEAFYHLTLQRVIVCRTAHSPPVFEPDFTGAVFSEQVRKRWLPLYVGCCSYQFRRHVTVVAIDVNQSGSVIVEAALIQSRWDYLRRNWSEDRSMWY
jgi:hypothetical protein